MKVRDMQTKIGYFFKDLSLLEEALTHSSFYNENKSITSNYNERLEFLGDSVLSLCISEYLFKSFPGLSEGELSKLRASVVCEKALHLVAQAISLGSFVRLGKGEKLTGGHKRISVLADACEALIGAIYLDGGIENAKSFILDTFQTPIVDSLSKDGNKDFKTSYQEKIQANGLKRISYELEQEWGPDHEKTFKVKLLLDNQVISYGMGKTKKEAEQNAAKEALGMK